MKTSYLAFALFFSTIAFSFTSCKKFDFDHDHEANWQTTTVDQTVVSGQVLIYVLPENMTKETPVISTDAANFSKSGLVLDGTTGQWTYQYISKEGFTGTDKVVIDSENEKSGHKSGKKHHGFGGGKCGSKKDKDHYRIEMNITVTEVVREK